MVPRKEEMMSVYYVVKLDGLFKKYLSNPLEDEKILYVSSVRGAMSFSTSDEANRCIEVNQLVECMVIDQNGQILRK